jgi:uroporphyrinogen decarboxylase
MYVNPYLKESEDLYLNSRQRFEAACRHSSSDRPPVDYLAGRTLDERLRCHLGVSTETELLDVLGADLYYLSVRDISQNESSRRIYRGPALPSDDRERVCPFGIRYLRGQYEWKFGADEAIGGALERAESPREVLAHSWPKPEWFDVSALEEECEANHRRIIVSGFWTAIFGNAYRLHGFERLLMNMALKPELVRTIVRCLTDFYLELNEHLFSALKGKIDLFFFGNDFGTQNGLLISEAMWVDFFKEEYRKIVALAHAHGLKVMVHSCGSILELIPHLIELGVDILDPVQTTAAGMDAGRLKRDFGERIVFHGAVDTQGILPRATPEEVTAHVSELAGTLGAGGGYIMAPCNNIQADTPVENAVAMYEAVRALVGGS